MERGDQARLTRALAFALAHHGDQTRKGREVPYVSHLLQVCGRVLEMGGTVDQGVAALLHDVVEDTPASHDEVRAEFGDVVAEIVEVCTDTLPGDDPVNKTPWKARKVRYVAALTAAGRSSALVVACDKWHNLGALVRDVEERGVGYLDRFSASAAEQVWYFRAVIDALDGRVPAVLLSELRGLLTRFESLVG